MPFRALVAATLLACAHGLTSAIAKEDHVIQDGVEAAMKGGVSKTLRTIPEAKKVFAARPHSEAQDGAELIAAGGKMLESGIQNLEAEKSKLEKGDSKWAQDAKRSYREAMAKAVLKDFDEMMDSEDYKKKESDFVSQQVKEYEKGVAPSKAKLDDAIKLGSTLIEGAKDENAREHEQFEKMFKDVLGDTEEQVKEKVSEVTTATDRKVGKVMSAIETGTNMSTVGSFEERDAMQQLQYEMKEQLGGLGSFKQNVKELRKYLNDNRPAPSNAFGDIDLVSRDYVDAFDSATKVLDKFEELMDGVKGQKDPVAFLQKKLRGDPNPEDPWGVISETGGTPATWDDMKSGKAMATPWEIMRRQIADQQTVIAIIKAVLTTVGTGIKYILQGTKDGKSANEVVGEIIEVMVEQWDKAAPVVKRNWANSYVLGMASTFGNVYCRPGVLVSIYQSLLPKNGKFVGLPFLNQDGDNKGIVAPNFDTIPMMSALDLSEGPMLVTVPKIPANQYYVLQVMDAWTNTVHSLGTRTMGNGARTYMFTREDWDEGVPSGVTHLISPTNTLWIILRQVPRTLGEIPATLTRRQEFYATNWTAFQANGNKPVFQEWQDADEAHNPKQMLKKMSTEQLLGNCSAFINKGNPMQPLDEEAKVKLADIGVIEGQPWKLPSKFAMGDLYQAIVMEVGKGNALKEAIAEDQRGAVSGFWKWSPLYNGNFGKEYAGRYAAARFAAGANIKEDAIYVNGFGRTNQLQTKVQYVKVTKGFDVKGYWSITMYTRDMFAVEKGEDNPDGIYSISSRSFQAEKDGSIFIYMGPWSQRKPFMKNFLPASTTKVANPSWRFYYAGGKFLHDFEKGNTNGILPDLVDYNDPNGGVDAAMDTRTPAEIDATIPDADKIKKVVATPEEHTSDEEHDDKMVKEKEADVEETKKPLDMDEPKKSAEPEEEKSNVQKQGQPDSVAPKAAAEPKEVKQLARKSMKK